MKEKKYLVVGSLLVQFTLRGCSFILFKYTTLIKAKHKVK